MNRLTAFNPRGVAAALVVLAALFHVQWIAACEFMPMPDHRECCAQDQAGGMEHCDDEASANACQVPLANSAQSLKPAERFTGADELPDATPWAAISADFPFRSGPARPPDALPHAVIPDGQSLYLTSSRLRL